MRIDAYFAVAELDPTTVDESTVIVVDVLRATTTIVEALANGAGGIFPTDSTEEAVKLAQSLGRDDTLLCGERRGVKIEGFDLGNSPREFTRDAVEGKRLVMSTTNGTRALGAAHEAARLITCAFTNLEAVGQAVAGEQDIVLLCAGREDRFSMDDALCAGHLIKRLAKKVDSKPVLNDAALAARTLAGSRKPTTRLLADTAGGRELIEIGFEGDLEICAQVDRHDIVPEMRNQAIVIAHE